MVYKNVRKAITVAELIITVAIIGVVGILTIGAIRGNATQMEYRIAQAKMMDSISTALANMQLESQLTGYGNTTAFAQNFQNYYAVSAMSEQEVQGLNSKISKLPSEVTSTLGDDVVYMKGSNGELLAVSYNRNYAPASQYTKMAATELTSATDSVDFRNEAVSAISGYYDVNGLNVGPNKIGQDIQVIQPYAQGTNLTCEGNFVPGNGGECICSVTQRECATMGKTFNSQACVCEVNCPVGKTYSEEEGACVCTLNEESCRAPYSEFDAESCTCKATVGASAKCKENGGTWNEDGAFCECLPTTDENSCEAKSYGYATADANNFCKCTCKSPAEITNLVAQRASNRADATTIRNYTVPSSDVENGCFYCKEKPADITAFSIEEENGLCTPKPLIDPSSCPNDGVFTVWQAFNPTSPNDSFYCKCILTQNHCDKVLNKAHKDYFGYEARTNTCMTDSSDRCRANVDACIADPRSAACKNTINNCSSRTSTPHYACSMSFHGGSWKDSVKNGSLVAQNPSSGKIGMAANADANTCYCAVSDGVMKASVPRTTFFHGAYGIAEENRYDAFYGKDLPAFSGAYVDDRKVGPIKNVMVLESYSSWYDPIVLNVNADNAFAVPQTTGVEVPFKDYEGNDITTAWIARYTSPSYYFLVKDKNNDEQINDLTEMYSEAGGLVTGLQMLNMDFSDYLKKEYKIYSDDQIKEAQVLIGYPELANKGLKTWADMNSNAVVDDGDVFEPLLALKAEYIEIDDEDSSVEEAVEGFLEEVIGEHSNNGKGHNGYGNIGNWVKQKQKETKLVFTEISGTGIFEIYTGYTMISTSSGKPERSDNSTVAIQGKYSILKPIDKAAVGKGNWVEIVPKKAGTNPNIEYKSAKTGITTGINIDVYQDTINSSLKGVNKLVWSCKNRWDQDVRRYLVVYTPSGEQYYEVVVRGLTDVIFDKK